VKLTASDLTLTRGGRDLVRGLSFGVAGGEALLLTGANGAGKSTLIRALSGLFPPSQGVIGLEGCDEERSLGEQAHTIGHLNALKGTMTARENLAFWASYLGTAAAERADRVGEALDRFGLMALAEIPAAYLSAGQKRRLGLARLLVAERPVWLLDEPTVSLDAASTARVGEVMAAHVARGGIVIAATHLPLGLTGARELNLSELMRDDEAV